MKTVFFTDSGSNLTKSQAKQMGVQLITMPYILNGEVYYNDGEVKVDETQITTSALNEYEYQQLFEPYKDHHKVYVSFSQKQSSTFDNLRRANIPNLTIIDSQFIAMGVQAVLERVMQEQDFSGIRFFFITNNSNKGARVEAKEYTLFEMVEGMPKELKTYPNVMEALKALRNNINSPLQYGCELNNALRLHLGKGYVGGVYVN